MSTPVIELAHVGKTFRGAKGDTLHVLSDVDLTITEGEIVALLGRSGSGKSTILRIISGLIPESSGSVRYRGQPLRGTNPGSAMVFQSFALMPWLTVTQNVELGLVARNVARSERARLAAGAIDMIGLTGFENSYPRELSGGMRQRVGFARAMVLTPDLLLMDEPFSALDVFTAESLRNTVSQLWQGGDFPARAACIVTHNIDEAVYLADRVVVLGSNPGRIVADVPIDLPRPRLYRTSHFQALADHIHGLLGSEQNVGDVSQLGLGDCPYDTAITS